MLAYLKYKLAARRNNRDSPRQTVAGQDGAIAPKPIPKPLGDIQKNHSKNSSDNPPFVVASDANN